MSFQLVGQVVGSYFGPIGSFVGGVLGGAIDRANAPDGPGPGDLSAPGIALGTRLPRVYGTVRVPVHPISISDFRATESGGGGKGGPTGPTSYSYSLDTLGAISDGTNVLAITRIWLNKKLVYTAHASSDNDSLVASTATDYWSGFLLQTGGPSQTPAPAYEDRVTTANALAYRGMCTVEFTDVQCGGSKTPPALEVEVVTNATPATTGALTVLQSGFATDGHDESAYANGLPASTGTPSIGGGQLSINNTTDANEYIQWNDADIGFTGSAPLTYEGFAEMVENDRNVTVTIARFGYAPSITHQLSFYGTSGRIEYQDSGGASNYLSDVITGRFHWAIVFGGSHTIAAYINGQQIYAVGGPTTPAAIASATVDLGYHTTGHAGTTRYAIYEFRVRREEVYTGPFTPPAQLPPPDTPVTYYTPLPVTLDTIVLAELALDPTFDAADVDVTDLAAIDVTGYVAGGPASDALRELCDIFYVDVVPGNPIKFVQRGAAVVASVPFADTGAAVDGPSDPFAGLTRENADETPAVAAIRFPLLERDHEAGFERGDRLGAESDDVRRIETRVVMSAAQAKGRAIAATLLDRVRRHKASFALSDAYAALQPGDCVTATDNDGNTARLNARRMAYADGVRSIDWELDDTTALVQTGLTSSEYTPSYTVAAAATVTLYLLDIPILRDADNSYGLYACCTADGDWQGASIYKSSDDVTFTQVGDIANRATAGVTTGALADFTGWTWDATSTLTVTLAAGSGGTLSTATRAAVEADATLNVALVGAHGRWEVIRFTTATLVTGTTYLLSGGMLRGQLGTEAQNGTHQAGDTFILLQTTGMLRIAGTLGDLGVARYYKAVPPGRSVASVTSQSLTTAEVGLTPYAPVDLRLGSANELVWNRRSRLQSVLMSTTHPPIGEDSEAYDVEMLDGATVIVSDSVTEPAWTIEAHPQDITLDRPANWIYEQGGFLHGFSDVDASTVCQYVRHTTDGAFSAQAFVASLAVLCATYNGSILYAGTSNGNDVGELVRIDTATAAVTHHTPFGLASIVGVAFDGTDLWCINATTHEVMQRSAADLTSINTYSFESGLARCVFLSGHLYILKRSTDEVIKWNTSTQSVVTRWASPRFPIDIMVAGGNLFVAGADDSAVYTTAGVELATSSGSAISVYRNALADYLGGVAINDGTPGSNRVLVLDAATGALDYTIAVPQAVAVAGAGSDHLYVGAGPGGTVQQTLGYGNTAGDGTAVNVYQMSQSVGRGNVAEYTL